MAVLSACFFPVLLLAHLVHLKSGGRIEGWVKSEEKGKIIVELNSGDEISVSKEEVASIDTEHEAPIQAFHAMWDRFKDAKSAEALCTLVRWCRAHGMQKFLPMVKRALWDIDPKHDVDHKTTVLIQERRADAPAGQTIVDPKRPKTIQPRKITLVPTFVPPMAKITANGYILYPTNSLPGPNHLGMDSFDVDYWGIPPEGGERQNTVDDILRLRAEYSREGLMKAVKSWRVIVREQDVLLIPPNEASDKNWRLIYALGPRQSALLALELVRSGQASEK